MQTEDSIPEPLRLPAEAAVSWINRTQQRRFELTGIVDYEQALTAEAEDDFELGLVLCDGEICAREQVRIQRNDDGYRFSLNDLAKSDIPALLDPPQGVRGEWLDSVLARHEFVLLLFYRGLW